MTNLESKDLAFLKNLVAKSGWNKPGLQKVRNKAILEAKPS